MQFSLSNDLQKKGFHLLGIIRLAPNVSVVFFAEFDGKSSKSSSKEGRARFTDRTQAAIASGLTFELGKEQESNQTLLLNTKGRHLTVSNSPFSRNFKFLMKPRTMSTITLYQDGGGRRGSNLLLSSLMLLAAMVLSTSAQRNTARQRNDVTYAEINKLMPKCHPRDTCSVARKEDDAVNHFCHCNSYCTMFGTCCVDSQYRNVAAPKITPHTCAQVYNNRSRRVYMIDKCMRNWNDEYVKEKCLGDGDKRSDPLLMIPVTNRRSGITYKNYFCAACNGEDKRRGNIVFWHMGVFLNRTSGSAQSNRMSREELLRMRYRNDKWEIRGSTNVHTVWFELDIPSSITRHVKFCEKVISTCLADWKGDVTKAKCGSYMAIVGAEHGAVNNWGTRYKRFRNLHCALCNRVSMDALECEVPIDTYPPERTPFNVGFLVDINRADGDVPGRRRRCRTRQIFDPVKQTCVRSAGCFAGHVLRNGQCFRVISG